MPALRSPDDLGPLIAGISCCLVGLIHRTEILGGMDITDGH